MRRRGGEDRRQGDCQEEEAQAEKKPSALDAAARVLGEAKQPMTTKEIIGAMEVKRY